ncbi:MAG: DUF2334 domain-containing protein [Planctomycetaceae bacterium]|nr:MAG: DUF2334 domain-containing protein [Planctomycetaceae bacterium]
MYAGSNNREDLLLSRYADLAQRFARVGIYTGYPNSVPPTSSDERILAAAPNTQYIIHVNNPFTDKKVVLLELDDVQAPWLEPTSMALIDLHIRKNVPLTCGAVPYGLNLVAGNDSLTLYLRELDDNYRNLIEVAEHGYSHNGTEYFEGKSYDEQWSIMSAGLYTLNACGIRPDTFIPPYGSIDTTTLRVARDLGLKNLVSLGRYISSEDMRVLDSWTPLTTTVDNKTVLKSSQQLMDEIDKYPGHAINVVYHIMDFDPRSGPSIEALGTLLDDLKSNPSYRFMTARQYGEYLAGG